MANNAKLPMSMAAPLPKPQGPLHLHAREEQIENRCNVGDKFDNRKTQSLGSLNRRWSLSQLDKT
jgi:hypothetical protein